MYAITIIMLRRRGSGGRRRENDAAAAARRRRRWMEVGSSLLFVRGSSSRRSLLLLAALLFVRRRRSLLPHPVVGCCDRLLLLVAAAARTAPRCYRPLLLCGADAACTASPYSIDPSRPPPAALSRCCGLLRRPPSSSCVPPPALFFLVINSRQPPPSNPVSSNRWAFRMDPAHGGPWWTRQHLFHPPLHHRLSQLWRSSPPPSHVRASIPDQTCSARRSGAARCRRCCCRGCATTACASGDVLHGVPQEHHVARKERGTCNERPHFRVLRSEMREMGMEAETVVVEGLRSSSSSSREGGCAWCSERLAVLWTPECGTS